jgi:hypothetical protein
LLTAEYPFFALPRLIAICSGHPPPYSGFHVVVNNPPSSANSRGGWNYDLVSNPMTEIDNRLWTVFSGVEVDLQVPESASGEGGVEH